MLITNVTEVEKHDFEFLDEEGDEGNEAGFLHELRNQLDALQLGKPIHEIYHDLGSVMQDIQDRFSHGNTKPK